MIIDIVKLPIKTRSAYDVHRLVPHAKKLEFFQSRGLSDSSIFDTLALMTYKEIKKDEFAIEYGAEGD